jgi:regulator of protease activity HflC (stomatin/prohibitin superfamily)
MTPKLFRTIPFAVIGVVAFVLVSTRLVACVPAGHVGVLVALGEVKERVLSEGVHVKAPHHQVLSISSQNRSYTVGYGPNDPNAAVSSDMQTVGFTVNISWYAPPEHAWQLVRYVHQNDDMWVPSIIDPAMRQGVKSVFSRYTLRDLIQHRERARNDVAEEIHRLVEERLNERHEGLGDAISITQVTLDNVDYSEQFEAVIEATQREEQRARLAENELRRIEIEARQQLVQAEAERLATVERSRGEAEALLIRNEAQVTAYLALRQVGFDLNSYRFLEQWNGILPTVMAGDDGLSMMFQRRSDGTLDPEQIGLIIDQVRAARERITTPVQPDEE